MPITIDNTTLTQLAVRRGTDASRQQVILAAGEPGYATDTNRLFVGDGTTYGGLVVGNKFLGYTLIESLSSIAQEGDFAFDPVKNNLYVFTSLSGFKIAGPQYTNNIANSAGSIYISNSFAGSGFKITGNPGVLNLDTAYWTVSTVGIAYNTPVLMPTLSTQGRLVIGSGMANQFGTYPTNSTADIVLNGSTYVNGTLSAASGSINISYASITSATSLSSYTTTVAANPNLMIQSGGHGSSSTDIVTHIQVSPTTSNWNTGLYIDSQPFIGLNAKKTDFALAANVLSTFNVGVSGNTIFTNNVTVSGDLTADFLASDRSLKDDITPITDALHKVSQLKGVNFKWKPDYKFSGSDVGVIAQDVELVLPEAVKTRHDGYKGVDYEKIIPLLIQAINELSEKVK